MTDPTIVQSVQRAIEASGGKQETLAERLGCAQQTVSKLLRGEIVMTADWAIRLYRATGIPAAEFYPGLAALAS